MIQQKQQQKRNAESAHPVVPTTYTNPSQEENSVVNASKQPARKRHKPSAQRFSTALPTPRKYEAMNGFIDLIDASKPRGREIIVKCTYHFEKEVFVVMNPHTLMFELMKAIAHWVNEPLYMLCFMVDGERISQEFSWESLGMENGGEIDVMMKTF